MSERAAAPCTPTATWMDGAPPLGYTAPMPRAGSLSSLVALGLAALLAVVVTVRPIDDFDVWYHLAAGRLMAATWHWPTTNTFAYTAPDWPWIDLHWTFQLLLYAAWVVGGPNGCIALATALVLATVAMLWADARRFAPDVLVALLIGVAVVIASPRLVPRPELLSFALLATYLWLLDGYPGNGRLIWWLVPLQLLWTNSQGIFAVGLAVIGCYWAGATLALLPVLPRRWREATGCRPADWRRLTAVFAAACAVCFLNPYGLSGVLFPFQLLPRVTNSSLFSMRIGEFRPPFASGYAPPLAEIWAVLLVVTGLAFLANASRLHLGRLLATGAFAYLSTQALRNVALFGWIAVPAVAANVGPLLDAWRRRRSGATTRGSAARDDAVRRRGGVVATVGALAVAMALTVAIASVVTNRFSQWLGIEREFGVGVSSLHFPIEAEQFARDVGIGGRPFNCLATGGYLVWRRFPAERVFVDGRLEVYPEDFFRVYFDALDDPSTWPEVVGRYAPDYALLYHVWGNRYPLARYLLGGHGWTLVYYDEVASLYLPTDDAHAAVRELAQQEFAARRARRSPEPLPVGGVWNTVRVPVAAIRRETGYGDFLSAIGEHAGAVDAYRRALTLDPSASRTQFALGVAYWASGKPDEAVVEWRDLLRRDPTYDRAQAALEQVERLRRPAR